METNQNEQQESVDAIYKYAANLLYNEKMSSAEVRYALIEQGMDTESASIVVDNLRREVKDPKKEQAKTDMLYGALWCIGGIIATAANIGFIFWGAIVFGAIQFFRGVANSF